jgi:hypothetical protein
MVDDKGNWKTHTLSPWLPPEIISKITTLPPPIDTDGADERGWPGNRRRDLPSQVHINLYVEIMSRRHMQYGNVYGV